MLSIFLHFSFSFISSFSFFFVFLHFSILLVFLFFFFFCFVWMTRSSELWIDGNSGHDLFLSHEPFKEVRVNCQDHGRLQVYMSKNTRTTSRQQEN